MSNLAPALAKLRRRNWYAYPFISLPARQKTTGCQSKSEAMLEAIANSKALQSSWIFSQTDDC